jgi:multidrug efflux pump subunit AcrA (membrane-fusion protein)
MKDYRTAFLLTLFVNLTLLAGLGWLWWRGRAQVTPPAAAALPATAPAAAGATPAAATPTEAPLTPLQVSPQRLQDIGVRFGVVERKSVSGEIRVTGNVAVDETRLAYVQTRFTGWIQKVFANATYQYVRKGQPLFTIYSPDLVTTEREYLLAKGNQGTLGQSSVPGVSSGAASLVDAAAERLRQWNVPAQEIERLESTGEVRRELEVDSPVAGYILERNALPNLYVQPETRLYTVADLSTIWVFAQVFQNDLGRVKPGDPAVLTVDSYPDHAFRGRVDFIYPDVDMATRTARVRLIFANEGLRLKPGMFANVALKVPMGKQIVIPATGVLQTGTQEIVFVDHGNGNLEPRKVQLGDRAADDYVVLKGLQEGDRIVTSANFLIDSEAQLQAAAGAFMPPPPGAGAAAAMNAPAQAQASVDLTTDPTPPRKGSSTVRVKLAAQDGKPIIGAQVTIAFFMAAMPAMGMASMNTTINASDKGGGMYEGKAELGSGGTWQVTIVARKNGQTIATKHITINVTGGM